MSTNDEWEKLVLSRPGAPERVAEIQAEMRAVTLLVAVREALGLTPADAAECLGVSEQHVLDIEQSADVTLPEFIRWVHALDADLNVTVTRSDGATLALADIAEPETPTPGT